MHAFFTLSRLLVHRQTLEKDIKWEQSGRGGGVAQLLSVCSFSAVHWLLCMYILHTGKQDIEPALKLLHMNSLARLKLANFNPRFLV